MRLVLDKDFYIEGDLNSFVLYFRRENGVNPKTGNPVISKDEWYYPNISLCIQSYLSRVLGCEESITVGDVLTKYNEILAKIGGIKEFTWNEQSSEIVRLKEEIKELKSRK